MARRSFRKRMFSRLLLGTSNCRKIPITRIDLQEGEAKALCSVISIALIGPEELVRGKVHVADLIRLNRGFLSAAKRAICASTMDLGWTCSPDKAFSLGHDLFQAFRTSVDRSRVERPGCGPGNDRRRFARSGKFRTPTGSPPVRGKFLSVSRRDGWVPRTSILIASIWCSPSDFSPRSKRSILP